MSNENKNIERKCKCFTLCELSFLFFAFLLYSTFYYQEFFEMLFQNNTPHKKVENLTLIKNLTFSENISVSNFTSENTTIEHICYWSNWTECDSFCGVGSQSRIINTPECGYHTENQTCYSKCLPCTVSNWSVWSTCSSVLSCVPGYQTRNRSVFSNIFCDENISVPLIENRTCYYNCSQERINSLISLSSTQLSVKNENVPPTQDNIEDNSSSLLIYIGGALILGLGGICFAKTQKLTLSIEKANNIPPAARDSLDSPCERGQLTINPLISFEGLKEELSRATEYDRQKQYGKAYNIYIQGSTILLAMRDKERNHKQKNIYSDYARTYIERAEAIEKRYPARIRAIKRNLKTFPTKPSRIQNPRQKPIQKPIQKNEKIQPTKQETSLAVKPKRKPPPLLSVTCSSDTETSKPKVETPKQTQHYESSSASSSDGDGDGNIQPTFTQTDYQSYYKKNNINSNPQKQSREKIKKEFPPFQNK